MYDICCVGHITSDKVINGQVISYQPGGTAWYFSSAMQHFPVNYLLVTAVAETEKHYIKELSDKGIEVLVQPSAHTVYFENIYGDNPDDRTQNVLYKADAFTIDTLENVNAKIFHLGPLLADDIPLEVINMLAGKASLTLDVQGYLRKVVNGKVLAAPWKDKDLVLPHISILKADVAELHSLTGCKAVTDGAMQVADYGVKEIIVTNGSGGSVIYTEGKFYNIPAHPPKKTVDATGCGDTYMAGYLYRRIQGDDIALAGEFAAAMAALKIERTGPFCGTEDDVMEMLKK